jgi:hypothetical protein
VAIDRLLLDPNPDSALMQSVDAQLRDWRAASVHVANDLASHFVRLQEAVPVARSLAEACGVGLEALATLRTAHPVKAQWPSGPLAVLDRATRRDPSALELPMLPSLRLLVWAAAMQGQRATTSPEAWRRLVHERAAAKLPTQASPN